MPTPRPPAMPLDPMMLLARARDVVVTCPGALPPDLIDLLLQRGQARREVRVLAGPAALPEQLLRLVESGCLVFETVVPDEVLVFADRTVGYALPGWVAVPDPFTRCCGLLWCRLGRYLILEGNVVALDPASRLLRLRVHPLFETWVSVPDSLVLPATGALIRLLALASWVGGSEMSLVHAVLIEHGAVPETRSEP